MPKHRRWLASAIAAARTEDLPPLPWQRRRTVAVEAAPATARPRRVALRVRVPDTARAAR